MCTGPGSCTMPSATGVEMSKGMEPAGSDAGSTMLGLAVLAAAAGLAAPAAALGDEGCEAAAGAGAAAAHGDAAARSGAAAPGRAAGGAWEAGALPASLPCAAAVPADGSFLPFLFASVVSALPACCSFACCSFACFSCSSFCFCSKAWPASGCGRGWSLSS